MPLTLIDYAALNKKDLSKINQALSQQGIIGIRNVPQFEQLSKNFIDAARKFSRLSEAVKQHYAPKRDQHDTEGYELGAEKFEDEAGQWWVDDKKASFYAFVPDRDCNKWPKEVDLKKAYLNLGEIIFHTGKYLLRALGLDEHIGLLHEKITGYGRMLHYQKLDNTTLAQPHWCGAHYDHGIFTGLMPAYYFREGIEIDEPDEAGLFILPTHGKAFEKMNAADKSTVLFQVGEFGQLLANDRIRATKHLVKKAEGGIERYAFALFFNPDDDMIIRPQSVLQQDARYQSAQSADGNISYRNWSRASLENYRAK